MSAAVRTVADLRRLAEQAGDQAGIQADFARYVGWDKSHVTRLKQQGLLEFNADGAVAFAASLRRIAEHADPARDAQRAATAGSAGGPHGQVQAAGGPPGPPGTPPAEGEGVVSPQYAESRAAKEFWAARTAQVEYERLVGDLVRRQAVDNAITDAASLFRQAVENQPHRLADRLVGQPLERVRALLRDDGLQMLAELQRGFAKRMADAADGSAV